MRITFLFCISCFVCFSQGKLPHRNSHAHNDYEHKRPLFDALENGFMSVEADVHLRNGDLLVAHNHASDQSPSLEKLYLNPLDSILAENRGHVYGVGSENMEPFYLMIDIKTNAEDTYQALKKVLLMHLNLCSTSVPVRIFLSGNRPIQTILQDANACIGIDGRPEDLGKGYSAVQMPVISDHFRNWSHWNGKSKPTDKDLSEIKALALRVHSEEKKLRLWSIPDNELTWEALLNLGVDFINTDKLEELDVFLSRKGL